MKRLQILGKRFGRLVVIKDLGRRITCLCDCKTEKTVRKSNLLAGHTKSCGCLRNERVSAANTTHGESKKTREYAAWTSMLARCNNPMREFYARYGGRGIKVCPEWSDYLTFLKDMGRCPKDFELDRIDNNGDYKPENCRWIDHRTNCLNK